MTELKFRAWDGECLHYGGFSIHATGKIEPTIFIKNEIKCVDVSNGLKDKNGRDVFGNDFVIAPWHWREPHLFEFPRDYYALTEYGIEDELTVVGNIHYNPELLK